jgi:hypothetical protein
MRSAEAAGSRRLEALTLAEEILSDIELSRIAPVDIARRTSRLARLLDDVDALEWLRFEIGGYPISEDNTLDADAWGAATRSNRVHIDLTEKKPKATTRSLGQLQANVEATMAQLSAATDPPLSISSANPNQFVAAPRGNAQERGLLRNFVGEERKVIDNVVGALHTYVSARYQELRFGSAAETAFEIVRREVDAAIGDVVPDALPRLSAAYENATSEHAEHWANAASTCRRLLKAVGDELRPPGPDVQGRKMGDEQYINRLVDWIANQSSSRTGAEMVMADLEYLGRRLDAADGAGHKGAHADVTRFDASRFLTGTYLLLGDILRLRSEEERPPAPAGRVSALNEPSPVVPASNPDTGAPTS